MNMNTKKRKGGHVCAVMGCKNNSTNCEDSFFTFPKDLQRAQIWAVECGRRDLLVKLENLYRSHRVCSAHFETKMFLNDLRNRLQPHAMPTIITRQAVAFRDREHNYSDLPWSSNLPLFNRRTPEEDSGEIILRPIKIARMEEISTPEMYKCGLCDFEIDLKVSLTEHFISVHKGREINGVLPRIAECYNCKSCCFNTYSLLILTKHAVNCNQELQSEKGPHIAKTHPECEGIGASSAKWQQSDHCSYKCKLMNRHICQKHSDVKANEVRPFECNKCPYRSKTKRTLKKHLLFHHKSLEEIYSFQCDHCSYQTKYNHDLKTHILRKHTDPEEINWHECDECCFKTKTKSNLKQHIISKHVSAQEINWFECVECSFKTKTKSNLQHHIANKHTSAQKINWFECVECLFKAKTKNNLKQHIVNKHTSAQEINWFECYKCSYRAKQKYSLKNHVLAVHTPVEELNWFRCEICSHRTKFKNDLRRHVFNKHRRME